MLEVFSGSSQLWLVMEMGGCFPLNRPPLPPPSQPLRRAKYCFHIYLKSSFLNSLAFHIELVVECDECPLDGFALAVLLLDEESQWPLPGPLCFSNNRPGGGGGRQYPGPFQGSPIKHKVSVQLFQLLPCVIYAINWLEMFLL